MKTAATASAAARPSASVSMMVSCAALTKPVADAAVPHRLLYTDAYSAISGSPVTNMVIRSA